MMPRKRSHYEVLGVEKNAKPAEVKKAYRRKARAAHPDAGGDHEEMAEVNAAFEVLSDPERRLLYDRYGRDKMKSIEAESAALVREAFQSALRADDSNPLAHALRFVEAAKVAFAEHKATLLGLQKDFTLKRERVARKGGPNIFHVLIDEQLERMAQDLALSDHKDAVCEAALRELKEYSSKVRVEEPMGLAALMYRGGRRPSIGSMFDFGV
jgi:curved DNA-binding protein CbpA